MTGMQVTAAVIAVSIALFLIVEFTLIACGKPTYSKAIQRQTGVSPMAYVIGFLMGLLTSHFSGW